MKNVILLVGVMSLMVACGPNYKAEVENLKKQQDSLLSVYNSQRTEMEGYLQDITEIQLSLNELTTQEQILKAKSEGDINIPVKQTILNDLAAIRVSIESNKKKLASVQSKLKKANGKITDLEKMVADLNEQLAIRDSSIVLLGTTIAELSVKVNSMETAMSEVKADNEVKAKEIADKTAKLNTAYYTIGTFKALRDKQVISNDGLIIKSKDMKSDFNRDAFTKVDITTTKVIALNYPKEVKVVSNHPSDSYSIVRENNKVKSLEVVDPEKFWSNSKYLVIAEQ
jgi:predicted  nucleic acid-binding Zn-ribbon protein